MDETFWSMLVLGILSILFVAWVGQIRYVQMREQRDHFKHQTYVLRDRLRETRVVEQQRTSELSRRIKQQALVDLREAQDLHAARQDG